MADTSCIQRGDGLPGARVAQAPPDRRVHDLLTGREEKVADLRAAMARDTPDDGDALQIILAPLG